MSDKTGIEWTDATWNPLRGCTRVSEGCRNCYAEGVAARFSGPGQPYEGLAAFVGEDRLPRWTGKIALAEHVLDQPLRWRKPRRIFVNSMSDLFHESVPDEWIDRIFAVMALCPQHTFQVLTKRPERMRKYMNDPRRSYKSARAVIDEFMRGTVPKELLTNETWLEIWPIEAEGDPEDPSDLFLRSWPLTNVWLGVSVEDQATADERIPLLLDTPAEKRFISAEPLLGQLDLQRYLERCHAARDGECIARSCPQSRDNEPASTGRHCPLDDWGTVDETEMPARLDWVIVGGESGPNARPMHPDWARSLRDQCAAAGVPFFFKQWGEFREYDTGSPMPDEVDNDSEAADSIIACAVNPSWIDWSGRHFLARDDMPVEIPCRLIERVGKKAAGALLDGREHREFPA